MDINYIMTDIIEYRLGLDMLHLEKYYPKIKSIIEDKTMKVFSQIIPYELEDAYIIADKSDSATTLYDEKETPDGYYQYKIGNPLLENNNVSIMSIISVKDNEGFLGGIGGVRGNTFDVEGMLDYSLQSTFKSKMGFKFKRWDFVPPNIVKLKGYGTKDILLKLKTQYPNFASIPEGLSETFLELAEFDVKIYLWNKLKFVEDLETPLGNISLKIDSWGDANNERKEWIKEMQEEALKGNLAAIGRFEYRN